MSPWFVGILATVAAGLGLCLWLLVHRGDSGPRETPERPGSDAQFAAWLKPQVESDAAEEGRS